MKQKTVKAVSKRFKVTKNGIILKRHEGQDHFNARNTGKQTRRKRRDKSLSQSFTYAVKVGMPYAGL